MGLLVLSKIDPEARLSWKELFLFEEIARRASYAIENARLYQGAQDALHARDEFISIASHELKTPLTALSLQLQMFNRKLKKNLAEQEQSNGDTLVAMLPISVASNVAVCEAQAKKMGNFLDELLDLTRIRLGRLQLVRERVDLATIVNEAIERFRIEASQKGYELYADIKASASGNWDRTRLEQVVNNLISNALKYGESKPITVHVQKIESEMKAQLIVEDHGMGLAPGARDKIFERFERAGILGKKIAGLGLGLYICRQIVEAHSGKIYVESQKGIGSKFIVDLPMN